MKAIFDYYEVDLLLEQEWDKTYYPSTGIYKNRTTGNLFLVQPTSLFGLDNTNIFELSNDTMKQDSVSVDTHLKTIAILSGKVKTLEL